MYQIITGSFESHIVLANKQATKINLSDQRPSCIIDPHLFLKLITMANIITWKTNSVKLILTKALAFKQAVPEPDASGHYIPRTNFHL